MKNLTKKIEKKLEKLSELLEEITEAKIIVSHEPETWDPDMLYNLTELLKEALVLLEDQRIKGQDEFGNPLYEEGLCSLVEEYQNEEDYE